MDGDLFPDALAEARFEVKSEPKVKRVLQQAWKDVIDIRTPGALKLQFTLLHSSNCIEITEQDQLNFTAHNVEIFRTDRTCLVIPYTQIKFENIRLTLNDTSITRIIGDAREKIQTGTTGYTVTREPGVFVFSGLNESADADDHRRYRRR